MAEPRLRRKIQDSRIQRQQGLFPATSGAGLAARMDPSARITNMMLQEKAIQEEELGEITGFTEGNVFSPPIRKEKQKLSAEELNRRHAGLGLKFERPITEEGAQRLADLARARLIRDSVIRREPEGLGQLGLGLGASLLNMALDPLEVASVFVPVVSQARQAAWIARSGAIAGRARVGLVEGFAGNLMMEPAYMSLSKSLQMDYGMGDAIANVFLGSVLGGALGGGLGAARLGRRRLTLTEDMRIRGGEATEIDLDTLDVGGALNLSREQRALLPASVEGRSGLTLRPAEPELPPRVAELESVLSRREARKKAVRKELAETQGKLERAKNIGVRTKLERKLGKLDQELVTIGTDNLATRAEIRRLREESGAGRMELTDAEGNVIPLDSDQQAALAAAINGPSAAQRGQALKGAIAQMAQGKSVRVAETAEEVSRLKNRERLARGRVTQIRNELERSRTEGDADRVRDLEGRLARAEAQHQLAKAEIEGGQATVAQQVAADEQRIERSSTYDADAARRLDEAQKQDPLPEDDAVQQEVDDFVAEFEQAFERGEITEENLEAIRNELKAIDDELAAGERVTEFLKTCLKR